MNRRLSLSLFCIATNARSDHVVATNDGAIALSLLGQELGLSEEEIAELTDKSAVASAIKVSLQLKNCYSRRIVANKSSEKALGPFLSSRRGGL